MSFVTTTDAEWALIADSIESGWGKPFQPEDEMGWRDLLDGHFPEGVLLGAVKRLVLAASTDRGNAFPPTAAIVAAEANLISRPETAPVSWTEFWSAFVAATRNRDFPRGADVGQGAKAVFVGETVGLELGPIAASFAAAKFEWLQSAPIYGEAGGAIVQAVRREWDEHQGVMRERVLRGATIATPRELMQRSGRRPRSIAAGITGAVAELEAGS